MRKTFFKELYKAMKKNEDVWAISGDLGYGGYDKIREDFPDRFINVGAAEQTGLDIAVGLALQGKVPFFYSITPFSLFRPFETIRTYIDHENIPVIIIGSGRDKDYAHDGFSHDATDDKRFMKHFKNIISVWPSDKEIIKDIIYAAVYGKRPFYINLSR